MGGWGIGSGVRSAEGFEFFEGAWPVGSEQAREASVGEHLACGLAAGAVVGFFVGVAYSQNGFAASWAGLAVASMDSHFWAEGSDFFRETLFCFDLEPVDPKFKRVFCCCEKALPLLRR